MGPRGTGKSTWLKASLPDALTIDLLRPQRYRELAARPERLRELVEGNRQDDVVIDEIQRVPELLTVVHDLLERGPPRRFILTGSSARKLRRGGIGLLGGRAARRTLHPFMAAELPYFDLDAALTLGMVPLVVDSPDPADTLAAYATLYLDEEVRAEGLVRNVGDFARFLEIVSFSHGAVLNVSTVARDTHVKRKTAAGYIEVLEDLLLAFRLPSFRKRAKRAVVAHPKFYYFDAGVFRASRPTGPLDRPEEIGGAALEGLVAQHLRAWIAYRGSMTSLSYWRTRSGVEVDFVVYGDEGLHAFEVMNANRVRTGDVRSLRAFRDDFPEAVTTLLYRGHDRLRLNDVDCIPVSQFLRALVPTQSLAEVLSRAADR